MTGQYQPERGHFIWLDFDPQAGTEQAGHRPALVLSPRSFNIATGLALVCPVTSTITGSSFEVTPPRGSKIKGAILTHQMRSVDWIARNARYHSDCTAEILQDVIGRIEAILDIES